MARNILSKLWFIFLLASLQSLSLLWLLSFRRKKKDSVTYYIFFLVDFEVSQLNDALVTNTRNKATVEASVVCFCFCFFFFLFVCLTFWYIHQHNLGSLRYFKGVFGFYENWNLYLYRNANFNFAAEIWNSIFHKNPKNTP